jgi:hypothetical protein
MTTNSTDSLDKALLVFARRLVDEMRSINYLKEWSSLPLKDLLPKFFEVLNYHPDKLGDFLKEAYNRTFPESRNGNINQLGSKMIEPTKDYERFGKTRQYYIDEYEIMTPQGAITAVENAHLAHILGELYDMIVDVLASLTPQQENEHRTLERVCYALAPVYERVDGMKNMGFDLAEYADSWRKLSADERMKLKQELLS